MKGRRGFTLLELLVAIVLTGVVALLVYGAASTAVDSQRRLAEAREQLQVARGWHATLTDALRNARPARRVGDTAFVIEDRAGPNGIPRDRLRFVTAGSSPPLTADADWHVTLEPTPEGIVVTAVPVGVAGGARVIRGPQAVVGLDVRAVGFDRQPTWSSGWRFPAIVPRAIELVYWTAEGPAEVTHLALPLGGVQ